MASSLTALVGVVMFVVPLVLNLLRLTHQPPRPLRNDRGILDVVGFRPGLVDRPARWL